MALVGIDVLANDSDPDGDSLSIVGTPVAGSGTVSVNPDGTLTYTPNAGFTGTDQITYTVSDGNDGTANQPATVEVSPSQPPSDPSQGITISVLAVDPAGVLPTSGSFVASASIAGALDAGTITITDTTDLTFSDDSAGRETAYSSGSVNGANWNNLRTDNEYQWVLENTETGEQTTVFQIDVERSWFQSTKYWGATGELEAGVTYSVVSVNSNPSASEGVAYDTMLRPSAQSSAELVAMNLDEPSSAAVDEADPEFGWLRSFLQDGRQDQLKFAVLESLEHMMAASDGLTFEHYASLSVPAIAYPAVETADGEYAWTLPEPTVKVYPGQHFDNVPDSDVDTF